MRVAPLLLSVLWLLHVTAVSAEEKPRPNIVLIVADDLGYSDLGSYGGEIGTPNLDRLAAGGLRFREFYNASRCWPTRAALLTGRYQHQVGLGGGVSFFYEDLPEPGPYQGYLATESPTIAEVLSAAGYRTYLSGKWHVGEHRPHWPRQRGFDRYFGLINGASSYFELLDEQPNVQMALDDEYWEPPPEGFYMTDAITDQAVGFLRDHAAGHGEEPFFLYLAYTAPHWPLHALPEDIDKYRQRYRQGWDEIRRRRYRRQQELVLVEARHVPSPRPESVPAWEALSQEAMDHWAHRMAVYAAMVDRLDQGIGRVVQALEETGASEHTAIFFFSDNGASDENLDYTQLHEPGTPVGTRGSFLGYEEPWAWVSNTPFRGYKASAYQGGVITPLIVHWPGRVRGAGELTRAVGHIMDLLPTFADLAGATPPKELAGRSLRPVLEGTAWEPHPALYWEHYGHRAVRQGRWKLLSREPAGSWELYDLGTDPTEQRDVARQHIKKVRALRQAWEGWAAAVGVEGWAP